MFETNAIPRVGAVAYSRFDVRRQNVVFAPGILFTCLFQSSAYVLRNSVTGGADCICTLCADVNRHALPQVSPAALGCPSVDRDYYKCWMGLRSHFDPTAVPEGVAVGQGKEAEGSGGRQQQEHGKQGGKVAAGIAAGGKAGPGDAAAGAANGAGGVGV